jgi:hypothetical protein
MSERSCGLRPVGRHDGAHLIAHPNAHDRLRLDIGEPNGDDGRRTEI